MNAFRLAWLDLSRRPLSSLIAVVSIALSVATAGVLLRIGNLAERRYSTVVPTTDALIGAKSGDIDILLGALNNEISREDQTGYIPRKLYESLHANAPVQFEDGVKTQTGFVKAITPFVYAGWLNGRPAVGTDDSILQRGLKIQDGAFPTTIAEIAVGSAFGSHLGAIVNVDPLNSAPVGTGPEPADPRVVGQALPFKVVAVFAPTGTAWDHTAWMTLESSKVLLSHTRLKNSIWGTDVLNYFLVDVEPGGFVQLKALINDRTVGQVVETPRALARLQKLTGTGRALGLTIVGLVLAMAILSLASVLITRFESLSLQLAVLRAIGYSKGELARWLLSEGALLGLAAVVIGAGVDAIAFPLIRSALSSSLPIDVPSSLLESAPVWIAALIATVLSVSIPIVRAYRQDVHTSLRA